MSSGDSTGPLERSTAFHALVTPEFRARLEQKFELTGLLGAGGMGVVLRGVHRDLQREVAIKIQRFDARQDELGTRRFVFEAKALSSIHHPHVLQIFDFDRHGDLVSLAVELLPGASLASLLCRGERLPYPRTLELLGQIAQGLGAIHDQGIIHRDLKPDNILLTGSGDAKITDLGLATSPDRTFSTQSGVILGTPRYMSPEQIRGEEPGPPSDLYSLGVILHEMVTGSAPFVDENDRDTLLRHLREVPPRLGDLVPDVPVILDRLCDRLLRKDPAERPARASDLLEELRAVERVPHPATGDRPASGRASSRTRAAGPSGMRKDSKTSITSRPVSKPSSPGTASQPTRAVSMQLPPPAPRARSRAGVAAGLAMVLAGLSSLFMIWRDRAWTPVDLAVRMVSGVLEIQVDAEQAPAFEPRGWLAVEPAIRVSGDSGKRSWLARFRPASPGLTPLAGVLRGSGGRFDLGKLPVGRDPRAGWEPGQALPTLSVQIQDLPEDGKVELRCGPGFAAASRVPGSAVYEARLWPRGASSGDPLRVVITVPGTRWKIEHELVLDPDPVATLEKRIQALRGILPASRKSRGLEDASAHDPPGQLAPAAGERPPAPVIRISDLENALRSLPDDGLPASMKALRGDTFWLALGEWMIREPSLEARLAMHRALSPWFPALIPMEAPRPGERPPSITRLAGLVIPVTSWSRIVKPPHALDPGAVVQCLTTAAPLEWMQHVLERRKQDPTGWREKLEALGSYESNFIRQSDILVAAFGGEERLGPEGIERLRFAWHAPRLLGTDPARLIPRQPRGLAPGERRCLRLTTLDFMPGCLLRLGIPVGQDPAARVDVWIAQPGTAERRRDLDRWTLRTETEIHLPRDLVVEPGRALELRSGPAVRDERGTQLAVDIDPTTLFPSPSVPAMMANLAVIDLAWVACSDRAP